MDMGMTVDMDVDVDVDMGVDMGLDADVVVAETGREGWCWRR